MPRDEPGEQSLLSSLEALLADEYQAVATFTALPASPGRGDVRPQGIHVMVEKPLPSAWPTLEPCGGGQEGRDHVLVNYETPGTWQPKCYTIVHDQHASAEGAKDVVRDGHRGPKRSLFPLPGMVDRPRA